MAMLRLILHFLQNSRPYFAGTVVYCAGHFEYNKNVNRGSAPIGRVFLMTVRERILIIKLLEQQEKRPECLKKLGVHITMNPVVSTDKKERNKKQDV